MHLCPSSGPAHLGILAATGAGAAAVAPRLVRVRMGRDRSTVRVFPLQHCGARSWLRAPECCNGGLRFQYAHRVTASRIWCADVGYNASGLHVCDEVVGTVEQIAMYAVGGVLGDTHCRAPGRARTRPVVVACGRGASRCSVSRGRRVVVLRGRVRFVVGAALLFEGALLPLSFGANEQHHPVAHGHHGANEPSGRRTTPGTAFPRKECAIAHNCQVFIDSAGQRAVH